ncbi:MAG TPA: putative metal-binding motif-containing protein, partial [Kofleriaceae bacterium]|nr:putative metal-binding motif-containing protein [Kofleriaceae bacterium]
MGPGGTLRALAFVACAVGLGVIGWRLAPVDGRQAVAKGTCDADGDGVRSLACGGTDCADHDARRFPGNAEVCDAAGHDEDCDPTTYGVRDVDGDRYHDDTCCNTDSAGARRCGSDCDDAVSAVHPTQVEICNQRDDDCDGLTDEDMPRYSWAPDCDGDGFGDGAAARDGCGPGVTSPTCAAAGAVAHPVWVANAGDCRDDNPALHPGVLVCDPAGGARAARDACGGAALQCARGQSC